MSQMLKAAIVKGAQTPAVVFGLVDLLKSETSEASDDVSGAPEEPEVEVEVEAPRPTSAAHALLDDDEDE